MLKSDARELTLKAIDNIQNVDTNLSEIMDAIRYATDDGKWNTALFYKTSIYPISLVQKLTDQLVKLGYKVTNDHSDTYFQIGVDWSDND